MRNFTSNIDDDEIASSRDNRNSTFNRPDIDPGMEDEDNWANIGSDDSSDIDSDGWGGSFGSRSPFDENPFSGRPMGNPMGGGFSQRYGNPEDNKFKKQENPEDKVWDTVVKAGAGSINFIKDIYASFKSFDVLHRLAYGRNLTITGFGLLILSLILFLFKVPNILNLLLSSLLTLGIGIPIFLFSFDKISENKRNGVLMGSQELKESNTSFDSDLTYSEVNDYADKDIDLWDVKTDIEEEELSNFENLYIEEEEDIFNPQKGFDYSEEEVCTPMNSLDIIKELNSNMPMITRQYLYETCTSCLINKKRNFSDSIVLDEDSKEFLSFCAMVDKISDNMARGKNSTVPSILRIEDKLFYTLIEMERPKWLSTTNIKKFVDELISICAFNTLTKKTDPTVYGQGSVVGNTIYIKIMKGETALITLKDAMQHIKDDLMDPSVKMPVIFGVDEEGSVIWEDVSKMNTLLIAGMPRSGKSWLAKSILAQIMMFSKPSEVQFYLSDAKDSVSDYFSLNVPHIRRFVSKNNNVLKMMQEVVEVEGPRRKHILSTTGKGYIDIKDLKREHPEVELPYLYVMVDEVIGMVNGMDKETKQQFQTYLATIVTEYPNIGIRLILIPHVIRDDYIKKATTDVMPCRISVKGNSEHIERVTGAKPRDFNYKLSNNGDIALLVDNNEVKFVHAAVISDTNEGTQDYFDFLTNMWLKLEPDCFKGSRLENDIKNGVKRNEYVSLENIDMTYLEEEKKRITETRPKKPKVSSNSDIITEDLIL